MGQGEGRVHEASNHRSMGASANRPNVDDRSNSSQVGGSSCTAAKSFMQARTVWWTGSQMEKSCFSVGGKESAQKASVLHWHKSQRAFNMDRS